MATDARQALDTDARIRQLTQFVRGLTLGGRQATEDLVQETLFRAWRNLDSLPQDNAGRSRRWLFTVARRLVIDEARRRQARPVTVAAELDVECGVPTDETADMAITKYALRQAVSQLSDAHRQVLHEAYFLGRTVEDVAADLGIPVGTVRSWIHYALRTLRIALTEG